MKDKNLLNEEMPAALKENILRKAEPKLDRLRKKRGSGSWIRLWIPAAGLGVAGVMTFLVFSQRPDSSELQPVEMELALEVEMLEEMELLQVMPILEKGEILEKVKENRKWPKQERKS